MPTLTTDDREPVSALALTTPRMTDDARAPLIGVVALAVSFGVELMLIALLLWGPLKRSKAVHKTLTLHAAAMVRRERDLQIYAVGIVTTLALTGLLVFAWTRIFGRRLGSTDSDEARFNRISGAIQLALAALGLATFLILVLNLPIGRERVRMVPNKSAFMLLLAPGVLAVIAAAVDFRFRLTRFLRALVPAFVPLFVGFSLLIQITFSILMFNESQGTHTLPSSIPLSVVLWGITSAMLLTLAIHKAPHSFHRGQRCEDQSPEDSRRYFHFCDIVQTVLALGSLGAFALLLLGRFLSTFEEPAGILKYQLFVPAAGMIVCSLLDFRRGCSDSRRAPTELDRQPRRSVSWLLDAAVVLAIVVTVFIPRSLWPYLAGRFFLNDQLHHWNYFVLGPALQITHGAALYTEAYSQYGMAWPYLFAKLRHLISLTYANIIGAGITYGCIYFVALYFFLRWILSSAGWATSAIFLILMLQLFSGLDANELKWNYPSSTILRCPLDVWFFLALLGFLRSGRPRWIWLLGAISGLAILFELDTGIHLLIVFAFFWLLRQLPLISLKPLRSRCFWFPVMGYSLLAVGVIMGGLLLGSRGMLFSRAFWTGYTEGLQNQAFSGLGLIPISAVQTAGTSPFVEMVCGIALFAVMVFVYLFAVGLAVVRRANRNGTDNDLILACMGAYGLGLLLIFVGRSHPHNLFHPMIPFIIVSVMLLQQARFAAVGQAAWTSIPWGVAICSLALLWTKPEFLNYPSLLQSIFHQRTHDGLAVSEHPRDVELPARLNQEVLSMRRVAAALRQLRPRRDGGIVMLDERDTLFYYLSDVPPWSYNSSMFNATMTLTQLRQEAQELLSRRPEYAVIRAKPLKVWLFLDQWKYFRHFLLGRYRLERKAGGYEFWRRID